MIRVLNYGLENKSASTMSTGIIPCGLQVCKICLNTESDVYYVISKHKLDTAYENLTGHSMSNALNLMRLLCGECTQRLKNFSRFRDKGLRAHELMMDLVRNYDVITIQHIKSIDREANRLKSDIAKTTVVPDYCDLYILDDSEENFEETDDVYKNVVVKNERCESMSLENDKVDVESEFFYDHEQNLGRMDSIENKSRLSNHTITLKTKRASCADISRKSTKPNFNGIVDSSEVEKLVKQETVLECPKCDTTCIDEDAYVGHMISHTNGDRCKEEGNKKPGSASLLPLPSYASTLIPDNEYYSLDSLGDDIKNNLDYQLLSMNTDEKLQTEEEKEGKKEGDEHNNGETSKIVKRNQRSSKETAKKLIQDVSRMETHISENQLCEYKKNGKSVKKNTRTHTNKKSYFCKLCEYVCNKKGDLAKHKKTHTGEKHSCKVCDFRCDKKVDWWNHMKTHTSETSYLCNQCGYMCNDKSELRIHKKTHTSGKLHYCNVCSFSCSAKTHLEAHMRRHTGEKPFSCLLCPAKFTIKSHLARHMITHSGAKPFACDLCDYRFAQKCTLVKHMWTHTGNKPLSCNMCSYKCIHTDDMNKHTRTHTGERPFACMFCNYKSRTTYNLVTHMRTHTGEKPFKCTLCHYKFARSSQLVRHMRTHTGEKRFTCEVCGYKCTRHCNLMMHMRVHTGEKLTCDYCQYKSITRSIFIQHIRAHMEEIKHSK